MKEQISKLKLKSLIGLTLFTISIITAYFYLNHLIIGAISIVGMVVGWFVFSTNHTEITKIKLKQITDEYIKEKFKND